MPVTILRRDTYRTLPWKNGQGETDEIHLAPEGAVREDFELRISSAPIVEEGVFSAFPGAERCITLIEGSGLVLDFGEHAATLRLFQPYRFDTGLAPSSKPLDGPVRVINVMAARSRWTIAAFRCLAAAEALATPPRGMSVLFAVTGKWRLDGPDSRHEAQLGPRDTALISGEDSLAAIPADAGARAVLVVLEPAG